MIHKKTASMINYFVFASSTMVVLPVGLLKIGDDNQANGANQGKEKANYIQLPNMFDICRSRLVVLHLTEAKVGAETRQ